MSDDLVKRLRSMLEGNLRPSPLGKRAADRIEELEAKLAKCEALMHAGFAEYKRRLVMALEALDNLVQHTHKCEKELTEELHRQDFCGESLPLTNARTVLKELEGERDE